MAINGIIDTQRINVIAGSNPSGWGCDGYGRCEQNPLLGLMFRRLAVCMPIKSLIATETGVGVSNLGDIGTYMAQFLLIPQER
ncbi:hypothetical protein J4727_15555 [Providencia rettgeri]|uniref:Uncharacterized protein n=1 Tax=Providencia rettgeri TaxID=587 RepID=A0A939NCR9_PRORE|nr:hypothetical protein [Providencia rettgeri]